MTLNLRQRQTECLIRMLNLNQTPQGAAGEQSSSEAYKILIYDSHCQRIFSPLILVSDLRKHGVTLHFLIRKDRNPVPGVPAVYFIRPTPENIRCVVSDASRSLYDSIYLNFSHSIPRPVLEELASSALASSCADRFSRIYDQYLEFLTLEESLFSLAMPDCYLRLNDPRASEADIEQVVREVVDGLFCVLVTLGVVPVIRCPKGGPAEMVADALDHKLRDHLSSQNNLFVESARLSSFQRPVLCLFDRNIELSVGIQHDFRYRPLVHDVLGLKLNRLTVQEQNGGKKNYDLDGSDPFWAENGGLEFPEVAVEVDTQLSKYKKDVEEVNRKTGGGDIAEFDGTGNTKHLVNAVNSLPELTERKKIIDKHMNIATALLGKIKERSLDTFARKENDMMIRGAVDRSEIITVLKGNGTKMDKLRLAIIYLISSETLNPPDVEAVESALREAEVDTSAFHYVKKIKSLSVSLASASSASRSNIVDWAEKLYGQSISAMTAGMKNLLSSDRQLALTRLVDSLMDGKGSPEVESYAAFDPRAAKSSGGGPFKEAIVFMIGGGNYVEYGDLQELARRQQPPKNILYGCTEIVSGSELVDQLTVLGQKMGFASAPPQPAR